ncbi:MAG: AraC family transcriptional regulator, partial [Treponema sp.]|nr:AraC family transcriptional regulator [Treponema sp.]
AMKLGARDYIFKLTVKPEELIKTLDELDKDASQKQQQDQMGELIRANLSAIKYNLLRKCMKPESTTTEEILNQFKTLKLEVDLLKPYRILYVTIDSFEKLQLSGEYGDLPVVKSSMENIIRELLGMEYKMEPFNYEKGDIAVFINIPPEETGISGEKKQQDEDKLAGEFSRIGAYIKRYLGFTISGVLSPELEGVEAIPGVIRFCRESLRCRNSESRLCPYTGGFRKEIARAMEFIALHPGEKLGVQETAAHVGMSESYFSHIFKKETGINFVDYVNRIKMEKAAVLLETSTLKIADIASQVGIDNSNYFSVIFKKIIGCTPQEYRAGFNIKK